jgi:PiT family inorganic phosphate transporter
LGFVSVLVLVTGLFVGWSLGANDGANAMGTAVGARVRTLRQAVVIVAVFGFLGSILLGGKVIKTIGKGIVPLDLVDPNQALQIAVAAMLAGGLWITVATLLQMPVSTTHATVGAVAGAGVAAGNVVIYWSKFQDIFLAWILTPLGAGLIALLMAKLFHVIMRRFPIHNDRVYAYLLTLSGIYMAFTWGANDVANATGLIVGAGVLSPQMAAGLGGLAIAAGVSTMGYRVMETIGTRITHLVPAMAFIAELAAAVNVHLYTSLGIPVSTTHAIVGAVFGVGLANGRAALNARTARDIVMAWAATPLAAGFLAFIVYHVINPIFLLQSCQP